MIGKLKPGTQRRLDWFRCMHEVYQGMPTTEQEELHAWEKANLDGHSVGTSDWPGWLKYLPPPPWKQQ